jgi:hypothetical protein
MLKLVSISALVLLIGAPAAMASEETSLRATADALKAPPSEVRSEEDQARARSSIAWGDVFAATNLLEQANAGASTVVSRFNLATAYERTGRLGQAANLYRGLVRDGQFTTAILDPDYLTADRRSRWVNVADESAARLSVLDRLAQQRQAAGGQPFSAAEAGVNVAAVEGAPAGRISDDLALRLDAAAAAGRRARGTP